MGQVCAVASQSSQTLEAHGRTVHHTVMLLDSNIQPLQCCIVSWCAANVTIWLQVDQAMHSAGCSQSQNINSCGGTHSWGVARAMVSTGLQGAVQAPARRAGRTAEPGLACRIDAARRVVEADSILALADMTNNKAICNSGGQIGQGNLVSPMQ